jgi:hypothetical protein
MSSEIAYQFERSQDTASTDVWLDVLEQALRDKREAHKAEVSAQVIAIHAERIRRTEMIARSLGYDLPSPNPRVAQAEVAAGPRSLSGGFLSPEGE